MRYDVVIENAGPSFSAHLPDLQGCVGTGSSVAEVEREIREAIDLHVEGMRADDDPITRPSSSAHSVEVAA